MTLHQGTRLALWLVPNCPNCGVLTALPCKLLGRQYGGALTIASVLPRLKCKRCGARAVSVQATDRPDGLGQGGPTPTYVVELMG